jgi:poly(3-hydroxybutyrate) depolymerase
MGSNHHRNLAALVLAFCWSLAAALEGNAPEQTQSLTDVICGGRPRIDCEVELDVPEACANGEMGADPSCPIVFFLHGSGGTNNLFARTSGVHDAKMIGVYPQGEGGWNTGPKSSNHCHWSDYSCTTDPDEGDFISSIIDEVRSKGGSGNVYVYGNSNGAALAHRLASNGGTQLPIKGIIVSVTQLLSSPERSGPGFLNYNQPRSGTPPVSILSIMGDADPLIPYNGGSSSVFGGDEAFQLMPTMDSMASWASHNGCTGVYQTSQHSSNMGDGLATKYDYTDGCPAGIFVEHYAIHGGQHNAGGAEVDGAKIDVLGFVAKVERGGGSTPPPPSPPTAGCENDPSWSGKFNKAHTCDYVAENPANRCSFEDSKGMPASEACPGACDPSCGSPPTTPSPVPNFPITSSPVVAPPPPPPASCENDSSWSGRFSTDHTCDFVAENPANRCFFENSDGVKASNACPKACNSSCDSSPTTNSPIPPSPVTSSPNASQVAPPPSPTLGCENDPNWSGKFNTAHTCDYVGENPSNRCTFENSDGVKASNACPKVCNSACATSSRVRKRKMRR